MKNKKSFLDVCQKDVKEIYDIINPYLPSFDVCNLNQSVIYEPNKKILCRSLKNDKKDVVGHEIAIYVYDTGEIVRLIKRESSLKFEKHYYCGDDSIKEMVKISYKNDIVRRYFAYCNGANKSELDEKFDINIDDDIYDYNNSGCIEYAFLLLKSQNKVKKRA